MSPLLLLLPKRRLTCVALAVLSVFLLTVSMLFWENFNLMQAATVNDNEDPALLFELQSQRFQNRLLSDNALKSVSAVIRNARQNMTANSQRIENEELIEQQFFNSDPIRSNPLNLAQCQNALIDKFHLNKEDLLSRHLPNIQCKARGRRQQRDRNKDHAFIPHIWSREFLSALQSDACFEPKTPVRSISDLYSAGHYKEADNEVPVFYHIPKCGSSSTAAMTSDLFNFTIHWQEGPERMHEAVRTRCGFAFIRDPMQRFISAYYSLVCCL